MVALEHAAGGPADHLEDADLAALRYALHRGAELAHGLAPPAATWGPHAELADALEDARDATAHVADALADGGSAAAAPLVWEWRGALFRVRLARLRLEHGTDEPIAAVAAPAEPWLRRPVAALVLLLGGVGLVLAGALVDVWPLWTAGIALVLGSLPLSSLRP